MKPNVEFVTRVDVSDEVFKKDVQAVLDAICVNTKNHIMNIMYKISGNTRSCMIVYNYIEEEPIFMPQPMILNESSVNEEV